MTPFPDLSGLRRAGFDREADLLAELMRRPAWWIVRRAGTVGPEFDARRWDVREAAETTAKFWDDYYAPTKHSVVPLTAAAVIADQRGES
ncbi:hypothetical protein [Brasilonema bromeliae]|uniref:Uncharacterized protein n=1 Tax=Brasilonema bromeliae SPC951 TaxID=385972 RepID=A0ABX1PGN4_9CYAN|nr:hypothetical protein [Brasilonema bromeliae]NMG22532.1 hypothetical protein [Brasilonema bromeliae SPC951]